MISIVELRKLLDYNPATGVFIWKQARGNRAAGQRAGHLNDGHQQIIIRQKAYQGGQLAFAIFYGRWPKPQVDHKNRKRHDDRISNLREATNQQQQMNRSNGRNNTSGFKGVSRFRNKWQAYIKINGRKLHLGTFTSKRNARLAYKVAAKKHFGEWACVS